MRRSRFMALALVGAAVAAVLQPTTSAEAATTRIAGVDRMSTSAAISRAVPYPTGRTVYIASGQSYADALAAGPVAAAEQGRLLLTDVTDIPAAIEQELTRLRPSEIVIVGGPSSVAESVAAEARAYAPTVTRIGGTDRVGTSLLLLERQIARTGSTPATVWVASGAGFADALAAGALAARWGHGLVLAPSSASNAYRAALQQRLPATTQYEIAGGPAAVGADVESLLQSLGQTRRHQGQDRYQTAYVINRTFVGSASGATMMLASGEDFPDGLGAGLLAGATGRPLYLVPPRCLTSDEVRSEVARLGIVDTVVIGGTSAVSAESARLERCPDVGVLHRQVIDLVNAHRSNAGLPPLTASAGLMQMAQGWSGQMAARGQMVHSTTFCNETIAMGFRRCAENIARTGTASAQGVVDAWMASAAHRANILSPNLTHIGVGVAQGQGGRWYWTQNFGGS